MDTVTAVVAIALGAHVVLKFLFFAAPYARRRAALDRQYEGRRTGTAVLDAISLVIVIVVSVLMFIGDRGGVGFLAGLWVGATLIQLYFHRFHQPLDERTAPAPPDSPIKTMSYAIQARPWAAWVEVAILTALVIASVVAFALS